MNHSPSLPLRPGWPALLAWAARGSRAAHFLVSLLFPPRSLSRSRGLAQEAAAAARPLPCFADGWGPLSAHLLPPCRNRAGVELIFNRIHPDNLGFPPKIVMSWDYKSVAASPVFSFSILTPSRTTSTRV
jgi:hypothetical protein